MSALRAFAVQEKDEMTGGIFFAEHDIIAKKRGANEFADGDISGVQCRRAPWADEFVGRPIPAKVMIAYGWWFECSGCDMRISEDELADRRLDLDGVIGTQWGQVYCSARCYRRELSIRRRTEAEKQRAIDALKAIARKRLPGIEFTDEDENSNWRPHAYVNYHHGQPGWLWDQVQVSFTFPGMNIAPATLGLDRRYSTKIGPVKPEYRCSVGDRDAFEAFAAATKVRP